ncbi:MAG: PIG-L family deacetylase, partial [Flavobacteriaceae bacterium]|nr:PIG-L family deacetylase [Flavobacteriaceae bacterium]
MNRISLFIFALLFLAIPINAQIPNKPTASEIHQSIQKLNFLGSVLYIAAHPDDENTNLISYLSNTVKARTAYLSLTRGDGGQNLIGSEIRELLGVIRTQELLAARRIDGGEQIFTRANDFGYSKHPDETLAIWNKEAVLSDVVWAIRNFQPDIIINRFSNKKKTFGKTHGHHTSSAVLSELAFDLAGDKTKYPEQLEFVDVWQPKREFFNTSWWFYGSIENFEKANKTNLLEIETGTYYPALGLSNGEVSSLSRSMHKTQGFGSTGSRGQTKEYLELVKGDSPKDKTNLFDGINTTWTRIKGGKKINEILYKVEQNFDFKNPSASIVELVKACQLIQNLEDKHWRVQKTNEIKKIIQACAGLYLEAIANESSATKGSEIIINIEVINRSDVSMKLQTVSIDPLKISNNKARNLKNNQREQFKLKGTIPVDINYTSAYWLTEQGTLGMYKVTDRKLIGKPETQRALTANFFVDFDGYTIQFEKNVVFKRNDPVKGEIYKPFEIIPQVTASITDKVIIFSDNSSKKIQVKVKAGKPNIKGTVELRIPNDWKVSPQNYTINISQKGAEQTVNFTVTPPNYQTEGEISPMITVDGKTYTDELIEIHYNHIPFQSVLMLSKSKIVRLDIQKKGQLIGYIQGAGDDIPASLRQVGYTVVELKESEITADRLRKFDAIILGIRAYNTNEWLKFYQEYLHKYVKNGGTLLVQYNTNSRLKVDQVSPLELKLSRDRVTDGYSEVK